MADGNKNAGNAGATKRDFDNQPRAGDGKGNRFSAKGSQHSGRKISSEIHHRSEREFEGRERERERTGGRSKGGKTFEKAESSFAEGNSSFTDEAVEKARNKAIKADKQLQKAKSDATRKKYSMERVKDEQTGTYIYKVMETQETVKPDKHRRAKVMARRFAYESEKAAKEAAIKGEDDENAATEAMAYSKNSAENLYDFSVTHGKSEAQRKLDKVKSAQKKKFNMEVNYEYQKWLSENPQLQDGTLSHEAQKRWQKKQIQRRYQKALKDARKGEQAASAAVSATTEAAKTTTAIAKKLQEILAKNRTVILIALLFGVLLVTIMSLFVSCGAMFSNTVSTTFASSYLSLPAEIDAADLQMTKLEMELQDTIDNIETDNPDYDEYDYNLGEIGHDPSVLIGYLSAKYLEFTASEVEGDIQALFDELYELTLTPDTETRTDPDTEEEVEVSILRVTLTAKTLEEIVLEKMDAEQTEMYEVYSETRGSLQIFDSPVDYYWYNYVSSYYGYRKNPITGLDELHRGVDIALPEGTAVYATHDGTVTEAGYDEHYGNYVVISNSEGYTTKYGHLESLNVSAGRTIKRGRLIGKSGNTGASTGSHLHFECLYNGEYYNPYFYFDAGSQTLYGENTGGSGATDLIPPDSYDDAQVAALMREANKYIGMDYVWGGSNPSTGFDCSGFVCWVFKNSGTYPLERTTAQGIYNKCAKISAGDAKPGDIIFFTGTYNSSGPVSHVGIYCGNGIMVHCGDPIKYASINTSYWQSHFYAFGRLAR